jgi:predicted nucleic acid-binding protein
MKVTDALRGISKLAFDTAPMIYFIERHSIYVSLVRVVMRQIANGDLVGVASVLVLTEVLVSPLKTDDDAPIKRYEAVLANSKDFQLVSINSVIARRAAELRATYNLKTPDALHIASAIVSGCDAFLTNDKGLQRVKETSILLLDDLELDELNDN